MSIKIYPGFYWDTTNEEDVKEIFQPFDMSNLLVLGRSGTGRHCVTTNIISQFLLCYNSEQLRLKIWDGCCELVPGYKLGIEACDIVDSASNRTETTLLMFLEEVNLFVMERLTSICNKDIPVVVIVNGVSSTVGGMSTASKMRVSMFMKNIIDASANSNVFLMVIDDGIGFITHPLTVDMFDMLVITAVTEEESETLVGSDLVSVNNRSYQDGNIVVNVKTKDDIKLLTCPHYYKKSTIRKILTYDILPKGHRFSPDSLYQWERLMLALNYV